MSKASGEPETSQTLTKVEGGSQVPTGTLQETTPGFLCLPIPDQLEGFVCVCSSLDSCPNIHCIIKSNLQDRPNTKTTDRPGMIVVPIEKFTTEVCDEAESVPAKAEQKAAYPPDMYQKIENLIRVKLNPVTEEPIHHESPQMIKEIDNMIQSKLRQLTGLAQPSTEDELKTFLRATESEEFKTMLEQKFEEIAKTENGQRKVETITEHFKKRGVGN